MSRSEPPRPGSSTAVRELSVFLPAYDEEGNIERVVEAALDRLERLDLESYEVIVVDDGSTDRTAALADGLAAGDDRVRVVHHDRNRGYGAALKSGFAASTKTWVLLTDGDGQFDLADAGPFLAAAEQHDLIVGYRQHRQDNRFRKLNGWCWAALVNALFGLKLRDIDCAFKLIRTARVHSVLPLESDGAFCSTELLVKLRRAGVVAHELPVRHFSREAGQPTGANPRVIARAFVDLAKMRNRLR